MGRITQRFETLSRQHKTALIPFVTAGDPQPSVTVPLMHAMVAAGADLIELGVPFSDPMADGPVIQRSSERALAHHVSLRDVLDMVQGFRAQDVETPIVLMGYLNPIEVMGYDSFAARAGDAGVDGVLVVDAPPEESRELVEVLRAAALDLVYLLAPTSTPERIARIAEVTSGFVYYVSFKGVTGAGHLDVDQVAAKLLPIRRMIELPVGVGFGIRDAASAAQIARVADAVIIGSATVRRMEDLADMPQRIPDTVCDFLSGLRAAIDAAGES
ncbi:tryptophan synthase subunit alpha [Candidatus Thiosymbion oneisti]|uniref:tryptophan synthase subunit alpha n=1 Tax=Candidatus Thiosymbion oneisti TaxID=589554 RepID=UPI000A8B8D75|nr:tryptophan synthase subunit alpha [Candidatus Thiosymbion oneisti]